MLQSNFGSALPETPAFVAKRPVGITLRPANGADDFSRRDPDSIVKQPRKKSRKAANAGKTSIDKTSIDKTSIDKTSIDKTSIDKAPQSRDAWRPSWCRNAPPRKIKRAQGRPGAGRNPWPACRKKCRRQSPQVQPNHPAFPARWCYGFLRALPGDHCLVATVAGKIASAGLAPASERQNHTTSPSVSNIVRPHDKRAPMPLASTASRTHVS
jgi:hypothetical protein